MIKIPRGASRRQPESQSLRMPLIRVQIIAAGLIALLLALCGRILYLQVYKHEFLQGQGAARYSRLLTLEANRGMITDRNGEPLAISTPVKSIWASPADMDPLPDDSLRALAKLLEMPKDEVAQKLADKRREFVYLKRQIAPEVSEQVMALKIPGIAAQQEYRRFYPEGERLAHVVGYTGIDGHGQEGFELARDKMLSGKPGSRHIIKDRRGYIVEDVAEIQRPRDGQTLALSIDRKIQYLAFRELKAAVEKFKAKAGGIVVLDAHTGEVLALANLPTFNPNNRVRLYPEMRRNRALTDLFEPGSTLKPFTVSLALDKGLITPGKVFDTTPFMIGPAQIRDSHRENSLTVAGILQKSSNVGTSHISLMMQPSEVWQFYDELGFGRRPQTGFPGEAAGRLRPYKHWRPIEQATMSFGHGISLSLVQLARAYTIFTNDGQMLPISFTRLSAGLPGSQVISPQTAKSVRQMLEAVTQPGGTAVQAQILGYSVGGKTGTARKLEGGKYSPDKHIASFVGFAPASAPRLIVAVMVDEPSEGSYYGGSVAGPVFSRVMAGSLRIMGIAPDAPTNNTLFPASSAPEVKEET